MMKKKVFLFLCSVLTIGLMSSCRPNDSKLQQDVQAEMSRTYSNITSSVRDGVVTLSGTVDSEETRASAERTARNVNHVKSVNNNIMVRSTQMNPATSAPASTMMSSDTEISRNITNALTNGGYNDVRVSVNNGQVTLTGNVNRSDLQRVMQIANQANATRVINQLNIRE